MEAKDTTNDYHPQNVIDSNICDETLVEQSPDDETVKRSPFWSLKSVRFRIALLLCFTVCLHVLLWSSLPIAMVCLVNVTAVEQLKEKDFESSLTVSALNSSVAPEMSGCKLEERSREDYEGEFVWTAREQSTLFAAMTCGGLFSGLLAGWFSDRYGGKRVLLVGTALALLASVATPLAARHSIAAFFSIRVIAGFGSGFFTPSIAVMVSRWFPPPERSIVIAIYTTGNQLALFTGPPLNTFFCKQRHWADGGWPLIFYSHAALGMIWMVAFWYYISDRPEKHRHIKSTELNFISHSLTDQHMGHRKKTPWLAMLRSPVVLTIVSTHALMFFTIILVATYSMIFFRDVLAFDMQRSGFIASVPFLLQVVSKYAFALSANRLHHKTNMSASVICKLFNSIGSFGAALALLMLGFADCSTVGLAVISLCLFWLAFTAFTAGVLTATLSIAPAHSGMLQSVCWFLNQIAGICAPYFGSIFVERNDWRLMFHICAAIAFFMGVLFILFGSAEIQPWAKSGTIELSMEKKETTKCTLVPRDDED